jgi:hypothetical protein
MQMHDEIKSTLGRERLLNFSALAAGLIICWIDSRPGWDDTGVTAGLILVTTTFFGYKAPHRPWLRAFLVGIWIPLAGIFFTKNYSSLLALLIAIAGAYGGFLFRKIILTRSR